MATSVALAGAAGTAVTGVPHTGVTRVALVPVSGVTDVRFNLGASSSAAAVLILDSATQGRLSRNKLSAPLFELDDATLGVIGQNALGI